MIPMIQFMNPGRLWWLLLPIAVALLYIVLAARRRVGGSRSTNSALRKVLPRDSALKRYISVAAAVLSLAALVVAYARPQAPVQVPRERATIVVTIDVSWSMQAADVEPNRLDAAKTGAKEFVDSLPEGYNIALVTFAGTANVKMPPTTDRAALKTAIDAIDMEKSTAIGEGIYTSLEVLDKLAPVDPDNPDDPAPGAIVLLSDGATNMGRKSEDAARDAKKQNVPVYTIAYGTSTGYVVEDGKRQTVAVDHYELSQVAELSGGKKYAADNVQNLEEVYRTISKQVGYVDEMHEVTDRFAGIALIFAVLAALGVISQAARWP